MKPANDNAAISSITAHVAPITISAANCLAVTGMSWTWCLRFARAHDVPIWRVGTRKQLIPGHPFMLAMERESTQCTAQTVEQDLARIEAEVRAKFAR